MSTIHPLETDDIRSKLNDNNVSMIDCPIGRTSVEARLGKSLLMLGGEKNDIIKATPILNLIGDTLKDCGGPCEVFYRCRQRLATQQPSLSSSLPSQLW